MQIPDGPFTVQRVLNNNSVMATSSDNNDVILLGKGLGFGRKVGEILTNPKYEKIYIVPEGLGAQKALALIEQVDPGVINVTEKIISLANEGLKEELHPQVHVALADHINFAITRLNQGMAIKNPFLSEIKALYPEEFALAEQGAQMINDDLHISIPREEVGFIALHLHSARHNRHVGQSLKQAELIGEAVHYIEGQLGPIKEQGGLEYSRLISHLQSCIYRLMSNKTIENPFLDKIKMDFAGSYQIAKEVSTILSRGLGLDIPEDEIGYLTMHIERINHNLKTKTL